MPDCPPLGSDDPQTSSIRGDEGHDPGIVDEHDSDADTIRMSSPEFWNGANVENLPVEPNSLILTESTPASTYTNYPGCRSFDCTHMFQHPETTCAQLAKGKIKTNGVESGKLTSLLIGVLSKSLN
jgi:hypothetical protein